MYTMNLEFKAMIDVYKYYLYAYIFPIPYQQTEWEFFFTVGDVGGVIFIFYFLVFRLRYFDIYVFTMRWLKSYFHNFSVAS